jgi:UDP-N-acetylglucosamine/UDP-N-acetylgalactosamine diphosphorylase
VEPSKESLLARLQPYGQQHLLTYWEELDAGQRRWLAAQLAALDLKTVAALFRQGVQAEDWEALARRAVAPAAFRLHDRLPSITPQQAQQRGQAALAAGQVGVILVAGGQGSRLGFQHPKGMYRVGPVSGASLFQILLEKILARSRSAGMRIPLYLMTSPATHDETVAYLRANENFGLPGEDIRIFTQGTMPAVDAQSGGLLLADKHQLALSPDGHGGTLYALSELLPEIRRRGLAQLFYCQVDNPLVEMCDPALLGYHLLSGSEMSTQVVAKRTARDNVGNVVSIDGVLRIIEYSDLNPLSDEIVERRQQDSMPVFWAGNTAVHVFETAFLERMAASGTSLPFHVARKAVPYLGAGGRVVVPAEPNAIKFERFIFDLLPAARQSIVVEIDEQQAFAPVKNASGAQRDSPETVRAQMIALHTAWLRAAGCTVAPDVPVEISPLFAQNAQEVAARLAPGLIVTRPQYFC